MNIDRMLGIAVRTSADFGDGAWTPGMPLQQGWLWAGTVEGDTVLAFELGPGRVLFGFTPDELRSVRKVASGFNTVVECVVAEENGSPRTFTLVGPRGRIKKAFQHIGKPI
ncbi:hypothetical protein Intca_0021 [Intrasporangium calvum DSM 43043]|uniref:Uncharacterized protein n=1 Tax=Intrasporangium calvum (strain ATCC 23552 / DSM 43043 / JCM 3097 / NBRC 12989 / NCIMB 10167 / NRRL B-3866 / 7 KIP) TaxID=710696 RepID=E6SDY0_INTC7|nr:hypothetical protein Intca_0021 [Intrasporangium calvum DSM 43043]